jgi:hypothetical protein
MITEHVHARELNLHVMITTSFNLKVHTRYVVVVVVVVVTASSTSSAASFNVLSKGLRTTWL